MKSILLEFYAIHTRLSLTHTHTHDNFHIISTDKIYYANAQFFLHSFLIRIVCLCVCKSVISNTRVHRKKCVIRMSKRYNVQCVPPFFFFQNLHTETKGNDGNDRQSREPIYFDVWMKWKVTTATTTTNHWVSIVEMDETTKQSSDQHTCAFIRLIIFCECASLATNENWTWL